MLRANNPPVWDQVVYGPIHVKENMPVGAKVVSVKARSVSKAQFSKVYGTPNALLRESRQARFVMGEKYL